MENILITALSPHPDNPRKEADNAKNAANIDYIAMMADIEIPTEEEDEDGTQC